MERHLCGTWHSEAECPYCKLLQDTRSHNIRVRRRYVAPLDITEKIIIAIICVVLATFLVVGSIN